MTATDAQGIVARYIAAWNETDPNRRRALVAGLWTDDATYVDPMMKAEGHNGIETLIASVQTQFPEFRFSLHGRPDGYRTHLRFSWHLGPEGGDAVVQGTDFAVLSGDGRLQTVTGFLNRIPVQAGM